MSSSPQSSPARTAAYLAGPLVLDGVAWLARGTALAGRRQHRAAAYA